MKFEDYSPMLALPVDMDKVGRYSKYWMEVKLDGVRCIAIKQGDGVLWSGGRVELFTRSGKSLTEKLPHIVEQLKEVPGTFVLDGELGYPGAVDLNGILFSIDFNLTMRVIGSNPAEARLKQATNRELGKGNIGFNVFDILHWEPEGNLTGRRQEDRLTCLNEWFFTQTSDFQEDIFLTEKWTTWDFDWYKSIVGHGGEGVMLKNPDAPYHVGKRRANTWYKVKSFDTVDMKIVGFEYGQGKYEAQIGALVVKDPTGREVRVSGMTDEWRLDMTKNFDLRYKGKMCEVRYFGKVGVDESGYRHPQFVRMRQDLDD